MSKTPPNKVDNPNYFIPKEITSPIKDSPGISKTVYTHITNLHRLLADWSHTRDKGSKICKALSSLRLHECEDNYYPYQTKPLIETLLEAVQSFENIVTGIELICNQMQALVKLQSCNKPIINSWSCYEINENILKIYESIRKELKLKQIITENIAHCRDENLIEVYVSAWEFETYFTMDSSAYLFAEVGLAGVS